MTFTVLPSRTGPAEEDTQPSDKLAAGTAEGTSALYHYDVLSRMVSQVTQDHAELRTFIYEFARFKLRKDLYPQFLDGGWSEIEEQLRGLEAAIDRMEAEYAQNPQLQSTHQAKLPFAEQPRVPAMPGSQFTTRFGEGAIDFRAPFRVGSHGLASLPTSSRDDRFAGAYLGRHLRSRFWRNVQLLAAAALGVAIYFSIDVKTVVDRVGLRWPDEPTQANAPREAQKDQNEAELNSSRATKPDAPEFPLPTEYGVYAVVNGRLTELQQEPIRIPDPRVALSAPISTPSPTHVSTGRLEFVVFRRDLATTAPDRVMVRIVARVARVLTFDKAGNAKTTDMTNSWVIRNTSYQMRVAPLGNNPEMIVVRPDPADFVFPAGRYALVLKDAGYDFTVDGTLTDMRHCLERTDALGAPIYSECRQADELSRRLQKPDQTVVRGE
jgi:hypothetical protein